MLNQAFLEPKVARHQEAKAKSFNCKEETLKVAVPEEVKSKEVFLNEAFFEPKEAFKLSKTNEIKTKFNSKKGAPPNAKKDSANQMKLGPKRVRFSDQLQVREFTRDPPIDQLPAIIDQLQAVAQRMQRNEFR